MLVTARTKKSTAIDGTRKKKPRPGAGDTKCTGRVITNRTERRNRDMTPDRSSIPIATAPRFQYADTRPG